MLDIYNSRLDRQMECKQFIFERHWLHFNPNERLKEKIKIEKRINQETKVFCRLQTAADYKVFVQGLVKEQELRERIHYNNNNNYTVLRRLETITNQIPSATSSLSSSTALKAPASVITPLSSSKPTTVLLPNRPIPKPVAPPTPPTPPPVIGRKPANPLDISNADGIELLSPEEKILCSTLRLLPKPYIVIKDTILKEYAKQGFLKRRATRALIKIDVNKTSRIYDFFIESGWITANKQ
ncbi:unnamed protein product [Cunninghamella echinulata]